MDWESNYKLYLEAIISLRSHGIPFLVTYAHKTKSDEEAKANTLNAIQLPTKMVTTSTGQMTKKWIYWLNGGREGSVVALFCVVWERLNFVSVPKFLADPRKEK